MRFATFVVGLFVLVLTNAEASACDRAPSPFEKPSVGVAVADVVVTGEVTLVHDGVATVKIATAIKGAGKGTSAGDDVQVRGATLASAMDRCGGVPIEVGKRYVFLLWAPVGQLGAYHVIDAHGGVADATAANEQQFRDALAKQHPHSPWQAKGDAATMLVLDPSPANSDDVDVVVVLRNIGTKPKPYRFAAWPRQTQTKCVLSVVNTATNKRVVAKPVPIAQKDISAYFSKHDRKWESKIAVGDAQLLRLQRITTAKQGWGYKEELGFVYYPVETPGAHAVTAECANVFGVGTRAVTAAVTLTL
jgi:hypothetical protein